MDRPWFDQDTSTLMLDEYVVEMDSYRRIVEDETITDAELVEQTKGWLRCCDGSKRRFRRRPSPSRPRRCASWLCSTPCR